MRRLLIYFFIGSAGLLQQNAVAQCCTIIDMTKETGTFTIRDKNTGRIQRFKPDALGGAELKVGDSVDANFDSMKITSVKGIAKSYALLNPDYGDSCCVVTKLDTLISDSAFRITAKNVLSGENIYFDLPVVLRPALDSGAVVFMNPSHGYAMIANRSDTTRRTLYGFPLLDKPQ